ncbi:MAG: GNAT family N-acetyltransferase [Bdellovibrio sp.]|nr:GNAT family N-acetyltransferase [Bdellovibrio sp.]
MEKKFPSVEMKTPRLILKRHQVSESHVMGQVVRQNFSRFALIFPWVHEHYSSDDALKFIEASLSQWDRAEMFDFSMYDQQMEYLGNIGIHTIRWEHDRAEIGYWIKQEFEGLGYVTEAVSQLLRELFSLGFNRIEIRCDPENARSRKIPERLGMRLEGHFREHVFQQNAYRDTLVYALLRSEVEH